MPRPVFHKGEQIGEWRHFDERLTMFLLRSRRPDRYGKWIERMLAPEGNEEGEHSDPAIRLDGGIERIAWRDEPGAAEVDDDGEEHQP